MSKRTLLGVVLFLAIIAIIYGIWAIQPLPIDDWGITKTHALIYRPPLPETGQVIRYYFSGQFFLPVNPFSLFRPWSLFTAIVSISLLWTILINEPIAVRAGLTLLTALGFPYLGHIGPWNFASSTYAVSFVWMIAWYSAFKKIRYTNKQFTLKARSFFILTFIAASWHEVWLITFTGITVYFIFDAFSSLQKRDKSFKLRSLSINLSVVLAWILAIAFYTGGGPSKFIDSRMNCPGRFASLLTWSHMIKAFLMGTKESLVLIKDSSPVFLLMMYIKLNKNFKTKLSSDFILFLAAALGSILFIYVDALVRGPSDWRARWLCMLSLSAAFYAFPRSILIDRFGLARNSSVIKTVRIFSIIAAVMWLSYNTFFTYIYTNIDVMKYLQYRQMVVERNPDVMKKLGPCTLPKNRPKGVAKWDHAWGAQDDRYRFFLGGSNDSAIHGAVKDFWEHQNIKR